MWSALRDRAITSLAGLVEVTVNGCRLAGHEVTGTSRGAAHGRAVHRRAHFPFC
jgi:hypothetical protein